MGKQQEVGKSNLQIGLYPQNSEEAKLKIQCKNQLEATKPDTSPPQPKGHGGASKMAAMVERCEHDHKTGMWCQHSPQWFVYPKDFIFFKQQYTRKPPVVQKAAHRPKGKTTLKTLKVADTDSRMWKRRHCFAQITCKATRRIEASHDPSNAFYSNIPVMGEDWFWLHG